VDDVADKDTQHTAAITNGDPYVDDVADKDTLQHSVETTNGKDVAD
jgi:hypothetical protein